MEETKKMLRKNFKTFTQVRYDLLNRENLESIKKIKENP